MPMKAAVREILPPKRVTWASRYSRSNTSRASRKGRLMISPPFSHFSTVGAIEPISADMLPPDAMSQAPTGGLGAERIIALPLREARELFEREYLEAQIMRFGGNISRTAAFIGMERSALHRKLKSLGVGSMQSFPN